MRRPISPRLQRFDEAYNRLGCFAFLCLIVLVILGLYVAVKVAEMVTISLEFGPKAYFRNGVHFIPHRGFELSNGHALGPLYAAFWIIFAMSSLGMWIVTAHLIVVGVNEFLQKRRARAGKRATDADSSGRDA